MSCMRLFLFLALLFSFSISSAQTKKLVVLGDSLTEGYGVAKESAFSALLEKKIHDSGKKNWTVINSGISGATTASAPGRMKWIFKSKPDLLLLILGANDGLRGLKVDYSEKNLAKAIEIAQAEKVTVVLGGIYMPPNYGKEYSTQFKKMYENLAKKYKLTFIPFILDKVAGDPKYNLADGIHPNEAGHKIVAETIYQGIQGLL
jgi:acyl-CoA thioesterase-1